MSSTVASDPLTELAPSEIATVAKPSAGLHEYVVSMKTGHTVTKHFEYLKETLPYLAKIEDQYRAIMTADELERIRNDPGGVLKVYRCSNEVEDGTPKHRRAVIASCPGFDVASGHNVMFAGKDDYIMDQHFACIGFRFWNDTIGRNGYHAKITMEQAEAVLHDPMVNMVERNWYGELL